MRATRAGVAAATGASIAWGAALLATSTLLAWAAFVLTAALATGIALLPAPRAGVARSLARDLLTEGETVDDEVVLMLHGRSPVRGLLRERLTTGLAGPDAAEVRLAPGANNLRFQLEALAWGPQEVGPLTLTVSDPLGLFEREVVLGGVSAARTQPALRSLGKFRPRASNPEPALGQHNVSKPGDGFEFFALREYMPGDSPRRINWKASARSGKTIVNQVSRETFARVLVLVDLREKESIGSPFPSAIHNGRAAAWIVNHHARRRDHVSAVAVGTDALSLWSGKNPSLSETLRYLSETRVGGTTGLDDAVRRWLTLVRPRSPVYIVTSAALDWTLLPAIGLVEALGGRAHVISPVPTGLGPAEAEVLASRQHALDAARARGALVTEWSDAVPLEVALLAQ